jgi:hypothetical protein
MSGKLVRCKLTLQLKTSPPAYPVFFKAVGKLAGLVTRWLLLVTAHAAIGQTVSDRLLRELSLLLCLGIACVAQLPCDNSFRIPYKGRQIRGNATGMASKFWSLAVESNELRLAPIVEHPAWLLALVAGLME